MTELSVQDLDPRIQKQVGNARKAIDKNPAYAVDVLTSIVYRHPSCLEVRRLLRRAQQSRAAETRPGRLRCLSSNLALRFGGEALLKRDPEQALAKAERMLRMNPAKPRVHAYLARAALALGLKETAVFGLHERRRLEPRDTGNLKELAALLIELGHHEEAARLAEEGRELDPRDEAFPALVRQASVRQSTGPDGWGSGDASGSGDPA